MSNWVLTWTQINVVEYSWKLECQPEVLRARVYLAGHPLPFEAGVCTLLNNSAVVVFLFTWLENSGRLKLSFPNTVWGQASSYGQLENGRLKETVL